MMNNKVMFSQPMNKRNEDEIVSTRERMVTISESLGLEVVNTYFTEYEFSEDTNIPLQFLVKSLERMAECGTVIFANGWEEARGCKIEHEVALAYGLNIIYEKEVGTAD